MAKFCPITNKVVLYLDCLDCDTKECKMVKGDTKENKTSHCDEEEDS